MNHVKCVALEAGHYGGAYLDAGREFPVPETALFAKADLKNGESEDKIGMPKDGSTWYRSKATAGTPTASMEDVVEPVVERTPGRPETPGAGPKPKA